MASSPYASSLGRLRVDFPSFLSKETYARLVATHDVGEMTKLLDATPYASALTEARASYTGIALVELALNRTLVRRNRHAFEATPFAGRGVVGTYLKRWDIENIALILSSKAQHRSLGPVEQEFVSSRDLPAGIFAGAMTLDDFRILLQQPTVDAVATQLVRYGYGGALLPLIEEYPRTRDIFPLVYAMEAQYFREVQQAARFFQGDEGIVRQFLQSEIDVRNILVLMKGKDSDLPAEAVRTRLLDGGSLGISQAIDHYSARTVPELAGRLVPRFPSLAKGNEEYARSGDLTGYEVNLQCERALLEVRRMRSFPMSLGGIFTYLLLAELERADLRRIAFGHLYGVPEERITPLLISPRL